MALSPHRGRRPCSPAAVGDDGDGSATFDEDGFDITFEYPDEMNEADNVTIASGAGSSAKATAGVGYGERQAKDVIIVQRYDLNRAIGEDDLGRAKAELDPLVAQLAPGAPAGRTGKVGAFPSIEYDDLEVRRFEGAELAAGRALRRGHGVPRQLPVHARAQGRHREGVQAGARHGRAQVAG